MKKRLDKKIVRYAFDPAAPPPLTAKQRKELAALAAMPDESIDTSDIPPVGFGPAAERGGDRDARLERRHDGQH